MSKTTAGQFASIFTGYKNKYVVHIPPFEDVGNGKIKAVGSKRKGEKPVRYAKANGRFLTLTEANYEAHLDGVTGLAVSPLMGSTDGVRDRCYFALIDIDIYDSGMEVKDLEELLAENNIPCVVQKSKSGGFHIYFFFKELEKSKDVRLVLNYLAYILGFTGRWGKRVEIFPEYDENTEKNAHCIFLPFFGRGDSEELLEFLATAKKNQTTLKKLSEVAAKSTYNFLPVCIESLLNTHRFVPIPNRNNFLFSVALFLLKFWEDDARDLFLEVSNVFLSDDFTEEEIEQIWESANSKDYSFLGWCKRDDLKPLCDKKLCSTRTFNGEVVQSKKEKNRVLTNVDFGQLYKYESLEPFYVWEVQASGKEGFMPVQFENMEALRNQIIVQVNIAKVLNTMFLTVKTDVWEKHIQNALENLIILDIPLIADDTDKATHIKSIHRYIIENTYPFDEPDIILQGYVYKKGTSYFFLTEGVLHYLQDNKLVNKRFNLYMTLTNMGARLVEFQGLDAWEFMENKVFLEVVEARKRIRMIEERRVLTMIDTNVKELGYEDTKNAIDYEQVHEVQEAGQAKPHKKKS